MLQVIERRLALLKHLCGQVADRIAGRVRRVGGCTVRSGTRSFALYPAVHIVCCLTDSDAYDLVGVVEPAGELEAAGAEVCGELLIIGVDRYRIERGVTAVAIESPWGASLLAAS